MAEGDEGQCPTHHAPVPASPQAGHWELQWGVAGHSSAPVLAAPTDSWPRSPASSWNHPGGISGDSLEARQGAGPGQQGNPHVWQCRQPLCQAGNSAGTNSVRGSLNQLVYRSWVKAQVPQKVHVWKKAWGSHCGWWEREEGSGDGTVPQSGEGCGWQRPQELCPAQAAHGLFDSQSL